MFNIKAYSALKPKLDIWIINVMLVVLIYMSAVSMVFVYTKISFGLIKFAC